MGDLFKRLMKNTFLLLVLLKTFFKFVHRMKRIEKNIAFILIVFLGLVSLSSKEVSNVFLKNHSTFHKEISCSKWAFINTSKHKNQTSIAETEVMESEEDEESESLHNKEKLSNTTANNIVNYSLGYKTLQVAIDRAKETTPFTYTYPEKYILFQVFRI